MTNQDLISKMKSEGFVFVLPGVKDQAAIDRDLEPFKIDIRKKMDAEASSETKRKSRKIYEFKPVQDTSKSYQPKSL